MTRTAVKGAFVAAAVCSMFAAGAAQAADKTKDAPKQPVQCAGVNACKGQGACAGATNGCAGQNACKGKGWIETASAKECTDKGGRVIAPKS